MDTLVEAFLESPLLPRQLQRLNHAMDEEHARRQRFYEEMTEDGKWEFINGEPAVAALTALLTTALPAP